MRRTTVATLAVMLLIFSGCSDDGAAPSGDGAGSGDLDLCRLVEPDELPGALEAGFPQAGRADDPDEVACRWETSTSTTLRMDLIAWGEASALAEHWEAAPRTIGGREVYVAPRGFTEPGGPVIECSSVTQQGRDALRITLSVDEPRGDLCAELTTLVEKVVGRLPA